MQRPLGPPGQGGEKVLRVTLLAGPATTEDSSALPGWRAEELPDKSSLDLLAQGILELTRVGTSKCPLLGAAGQDLKSWPQAGAKRLWEMGLSFPVCEQEMPQPQAGSRTRHLL